MIGQSLLHYRITARLGAGGMGEVYRARDEKLKRDVAVKVLPEGALADEMARRRFRGEADALSRLSHPHLATIHDFDTVDGTDFLVMELVEGPSLSAELAEKGALPEKNVVALGVQLARGLQAAHEKGIIHRDLKPSNLQLTEDGLLKILDFGLAHLLPTGRASGEETAPTEPASSRVAGTLPYMSPEQVRGLEADERADAYAAGAVLYEMATGRRPFSKPNAAELTSAILNEEPRAPRLVNPRISPGLESVILKALDKDPELRCQTARDLRVDLERLQQRSDSSLALAPGAAEGTRRAWRPLALAFLLGATLAGALGWWSLGARSAATAPPARFTIDMGDDQTLAEYSNAPVAFSPDGSRIAYVAKRGPDSAIYVRAMDEVEPRRLAMTERARGPVFSPDGEWILFESGGRLKKVHVMGGTPEPLAHIAWFAGASWGPDDTIVFVRNFMGGLYTLPAGGGPARRLTTPALTEAHVWPWMLSDGDTVLFTIWAGESWDRARIGALSLSTGEWDEVAESGSFARYVNTGHLLFLRANTLYAAPFDTERRVLTGPSFPVQDEVRSDGQDGGGFFAVSGTGALAYAPGTALPAPRTLVWVSRSGERTPLASAPRAYTSPDLSPDGTRILLHLEEPSISLWTFDIHRDTLSRLSFGNDDHSGFWSSDGTRFAFESSRNGIHQLFVGRADGSGELEQVTRGEYDHYLCDWSPDGRYLAYVEFHPETAADLWIVEPSGTATPHPFSTAPFHEKQAVFSPNGRWLAYVSDESGRFEVYVRPLAGPGPKQQVSSGGGEQPAWSPSGDELYYRDGGRMMAVAVADTSDFSAGRPEVLFEGAFYYGGYPSRTYDVAPDGRFIMVADPAPELAVRRLEVVLNWASLLKEADR